MSALRCIGWDGLPCRRPVAADGGAWCEEHRPVDLTGERWDTAATLCFRTAEYHVRVVPRMRRGRRAS